MPVKLIKVEKKDKFVLERVLYARRYTLTIDRNRCVGCELCAAACPKEAIKTIKPSEFTDLENSTEKITVTVLENKCNFCGICGETCIFGAIELKVNNEDFIPVVRSESFPKLIHEVEVDESKCPPGCKICEEECPLNLIKVNWKNSLEGRVKIEVDREHCPGCRICELKCPYDAIHIRKIISGMIKVNSNLCPEGCRECANACPIPNVLLIRDDGKIIVNDFFCVYCGACRVACPVEGAIELKRVAIYHTPVKSGAWNKALERLTSTLDVAREIRGKSIVKAYESVKRLHGGHASK